MPSARRRPRAGSRRSGCWRWSAGIAAEPAGTLDLKGIGQDVEAYALRAFKS